MLDLIAAAVGINAAILLVLGFVVYIVLGFLLPFMALSATRNLKQIRVQLERLNDTLELRLPLDGPLPVTRTGPLNVWRTTPPAREAPPAPDEYPPLVR